MSPLLLFLLCLCAGFSVLSIALAGYALYRAETPRLIAVEKACRDAQVELGAMRDSLSTLADTLKRINSRTQMREMRAKRKANGADPDLPDPNDNPDAWKAAMARRYPRGVFDYNG